MTIFLLQQGPEICYETYTIIENTVYSLRTKIKYQLRNKMPTTMPDAD